jgi:hypothetical protein
MFDLIEHVTHFHFTPLETVLIMWGIIGLGTVIVVNWEDKPK